jgi:hypothetical protein
LPPTYNPFDFGKVQRPLEVLAFDSNFDPNGEQFAEKCDPGVNTQRAEPILETPYFKGFP